MVATVTIERIGKDFGETRVLKLIDLEIPHGEFVSLVGPSGCGKSTLLRIIAGLEQPTSGAVRLDDENLTNVRAADRDLSMVFQSYALYPHLTVAENIAVPLNMRLLSAWQRLPLIGGLIGRAKHLRKEIRQKVSDAAGMLEISALLDRKPGQLSGGQRQRVALGRALVRQPKAFLLDEPLSNLDAKLRVQTRAEIAELHRNLGATFIYVTHDQVEAMTMSSRIAVMMDGEILQCDPPDVVFDDPEDLRVAEFIGSPKINVIPAEIASSGAISVLGQPIGLVTIPSHIPNGGLGGAVTLGVRPEKLRPSGQNASLHGRIIHTENLGSESFVQCVVPEFETRFVFRSDSSNRRDYAIGMEIDLGFEAAEALVFGADGKRIRHVLPERDYIRPREETA